MRVRVFSVVPLALRLVGAIPTPQDSAAAPEAGSSSAGDAPIQLSSSPRNSASASVTVSAAPAPGGGVPDPLSSASTETVWTAVSGPSGPADPAAPGVTAPLLQPWPTSYPYMPAAPDPNTGKAFEPKTEVTWPNKTVWWTLDKENMIEWEWHGDANQSITLVLSNLDNFNMTSNSVMNIGGKLDSALGKFTFEGLTGIEPGGGYVITMVDPHNDTMYYAQSDTFEVKAANETQYGKSGGKSEGKSAATALSAPGLPALAAAAAAAAAGFLTLL